ncbi:putative MFS family arabinose efflux permease [Actinomadura coerulea]|uniref:Putative MFS family arabinose efflux permease n=1 Tax=Actinomadura coerulea TaxID=46159 RepID=A0A7X0L1Q7_9ACTN|nr:MFS transporter [Actinomadura coerulea]MBB6398926.1 putative MFS family arabinose efflux permease [Actinomadura coerulea]GGP98212.1 sugar transporter [Actinomadura coerulea]
MEVGPVHWRTRLLLAAVCGVAVASVYAGQPVLGVMGGDLGVPVDSLGWFVAAGQLGYLAGLVLLVPLGDMLDRRRLIAAHLALVAAGTAVTAVAPGAWAAFSGLAAAGVFAVVVQTAVAYTASISPPAERGRNLGIVTSGVVIGILGARIVAGVLADVWGWRSIYLVLAALAGVLALLSLTSLPADARTDTARYGQVLRSLGGLFVQPVFLGRGLIAFFLFASFGTLWSGMALPLAGEPWHLTEAQIGLFGVAGLAGALGAARSGRWGDAGHARLVTGIALALLVASWAAIGQLPWSLPLLVLGVVLLDFAVQAVHVSNQHTLTTAYPDRTSTTIGAYMVFYSLGSALGAAATTALFDATGWIGPTVLGTTLALCALATWAVTPRVAGRAVRRPRLAQAEKV